MTHRLTQRTHHPLHKSKSVVELNLTPRPDSATCPEDLQVYPNQMPEPPLLAPFDAKEQRLYS